ncbi:hypothetical protein KPH14_003557 [Odynerus spinipes]|uniref:Uncharacterized protein n=1 Tax=Odynerus spinipes TaxID=1348599 RepID=A0AAD9RCX1_9HYME|nr:hypothetical protein KPH14_003557 [Odynerus spinipes]
MGISQTDKCRDLSTSACFTPFSLRAQHDMPLAAVQHDARIKGGEDTELGLAKWPTNGDPTATADAQFFFTLPRDFHAAEGNSYGDREIISPRFPASRDRCWYYSYYYHGEAATLEPNRSCHSSQ